VTTTIPLTTTETSTAALPLKAFSSSKVSFSNAAENSHQETAISAIKSPSSSSGSFSRPPLHTRVNFPRKKPVAKRPRVLTGPSINIDQRNQAEVQEDLVQPEADNSVTGTESLGTRGWTPYLKRGQNKENSEENRVSDNHFQRKTTAGVLPMTSEPDVLSSTATSHSEEDLEENVDDASVNVPTVGWAPVLRRIKNKEAVREKLTLPSEIRTQNHFQGRVPLARGSILQSALEVSEQDEPFPVTDREVVVAASSSEHEDPEDKEDEEVSVPSVAWAPALRRINNKQAIKGKSSQKEVRLLPQSSTVGHATSRDSEVPSATRASDVLHSTSSKGGVVEKDKVDSGNVLPTVGWAPVLRKIKNKEAIRGRLASNKDVRILSGKDQERTTATTASGSTSASSSSTVTTTFSTTPQTLESEVTKSSTAAPDVTRFTSSIPVVKSEKDKTILVQPSASSVQGKKRKVVLNYFPASATPATAETTASSIAYQPSVSSIAAAETSSTQPPAPLAAEVLVDSKEEESVPDSNGLDAVVSMLESADSAGDDRATTVESITTWQTSPTPTATTFSATMTERPAVTPTVPSAPNPAKQRRIFFDRSQLKEKLKGVVLSVIEDPKSATLEQKVKKRINS
jgi:hypothetical protein